MGTMVMMRNLFLILLLTVMNHAMATPEQNANALRAKYNELGDKLRNNHYKRPLYMESQEQGSSLKGDIYAEVDHSFETFSNALNDPANWCDALLLHLNIKYCKASKSTSDTRLKVNLGRKSEQPLSSTYELDFSYKSTRPSPEYFRIELGADSGPVGTHDYSIVLEAIPVKGNTFMHLTYSYGFGMSSKLATKTYLATMAKDKVGFTIAGKNADGSPRYVDGVRGVIERNTMRYYLAIDSYLGGLSAPPAQQFEKRLKLVIEATEQYALQLHEVDRQTYLEMKRHEHQRQQQGAG
jgi:hypothetical protein